MKKISEEISFAFHDEPYFSTPIFRDHHGSSQSEDEIARHVREELESVMSQAQKSGRLTIRIELEEP